MGRSTGLAYDVRKDHPYLVYDRFDFDVPVGSVGDNFDRYAVRVEEMHAVDAHPRAGAGADPAGPGACIDDPRIALPPKSETYNSIEAMIAHFKLIMDGIHVPPGEVYSFTEARQRRARLLHRVRRHGPPVEVPRAPALLRRRPRCCSKVLPGLFIADVVPTFGMINMIGGECDR